MNLPEITQLLKEEFFRKKQLVNRMILKSKEYMMGLATGLLFGIKKGQGQGGGGTGDFTPRLNEIGMQGSQFWYSTTNPFYPDNGLPNCTAYAWGRFWEIHPQVVPHLPTGNGEDWWGSVSGYETGQTPRLGAVICFADGPYSGLGHVAIVEVINDDGSIVTSNSAYNGEYFYLKSGNASNNWGYEPEYRFQGFIYNPFVN